MTSPTPQTVYTQASGSQGTQVFLTVFFARAPTTNDIASWKIGQRWIDTSVSPIQEYILQNLSSSNGVVTANWQQLGNSALEVNSITVDTFTAPGTNPVIPEPVSGTITMTGAQVATGTIGANVIRTDSLAANALTIEIQRSTAVVSTDSTKNGVSHFNSGQFSVDANGFVSLSGGGQAIDTFQPDSGTNPITPDGAGLVRMAGSGSITTVGSLNTLTTELTGLTNHAVLVGAGTSTITKVGPSATTGAPLISGGAAADPGYSSTFTVVDSTTTVTLTDATSGTDGTISVQNTSATANSNAQFIAGTANGGGDPALRLAINGVQEFPIGIDHTNNNLVMGLAAGHPSGVSQGFRLNSSGILTYPLQPAFFFYLATNTAANLTGDATSYTLGTDALTQGFQQGSGMTTGGTFTAPVAGFYFFQVSLDFYGLQAAHTTCQVNINGQPAANNRTAFCNPFAASTGGQYLCQSSAVINLNQGATVTFTMSVGTGANPKSVGLAGVATNFFTYVSGYKLA